VPRSARGLPVPRAQAGRAGQQRGRRRRRCCWRRRVSVAPAHARRHFPCDRVLRQAAVATMPLLVYNECVVCCSKKPRPHGPAPGGKVLVHERCGARGVAQLCGAEAQAHAVAALVHRTRARAECMWTMRDASFIPTTPHVTTTRSPPPPPPHRRRSPPRLPPPVPARAAAVAHTRPAACCQRTASSAHTQHVIAPATHIRTRMQTLTHIYTRTHKYTHTRAHSICPHAQSTHAHTRITRPHAHITHARAPCCGCPG
jgi:hypothetical protein